jgi:3,4-dihydroxy 2-butanone 4-phosphate synthase/GTP cyclohydrolase II
MEASSSRWATTADLRARIDASGARALPFVTLTYAQSLDGSIAAVRGAPLRLSGEASMAMTHELRAMHDGIMVGVATVAADDPSLTVRLVHGSSPRPLILDSRLSCPLGCKLLTAEVCVRPVILTTETTAHDPDAAERRQALEAVGAVIIACGATAAGKVDFSDALRRLPADIRSVMVEGGAAVISSLLAGAAATSGRGAYVDYVLLTIAPVLVGGLRAVEHLLPQLPAEEGGVVDFPRLCEIKVDVLDGADVVMGGVVPGLVPPSSL